MKTKVNMGRWNSVDDALLARIIIEGVRNGSTQLQAFDRAGFALNRTSKACMFRWNKTLRPEYAEAFKEAVKEHRFKSGKIRSMRLPDYAKPALKETEYHETFAKENFPEPKLPVAPEHEVDGRIASPIKPAHYHKGGIDVIGFLGSHFGQDEGYTVLEAFCIGNIVKYVTRYKQKNGIEDLQKAEYYLNQLKQQGE